MGPERRCLVKKHELKNLVRLSFEGNFCALTLKFANLFWVLHDNFSDRNGSSTKLILYIRKYFRKLKL